MKTETSSTHTPPNNKTMSRTNGTHDQESAAVMAAGCVFLSCVLYIVFLLSYVCSPRPNESLHHLKEEGLKSSDYFLHSYSRFSRQCGHSSEKSSKLLPPSWISCTPSQDVSSLKFGVLSQLSCWVPPDTASLSLPQSWSSS